MMMDTSNRRWHFSSPKRLHSRDKGIFKYLKIPLVETATSDGVNLTLKLAMLQSYPAQTCQAMDLYQRRSPSRCDAVCFVVF